MVAAGMLWFIMMYFSFELVSIVINLVAYYGFALPLACLFGFTWGLDLVGIWIGFAVGCLVCFCIFLYIIRTTDWYQLAASSRARAQQ